MSSAILTHMLSVLETHESPFCRQLAAYLPGHLQDLLDIEEGFRRLTSARQEPETLRRFFNSWSQTNNSAMTVCGLSNRLSMPIHRNDPIPQPASLAKAIASLNRIADEDLAVVGKVLHQELFYRMAIGFCGDDQWLMRAYLHPAAASFKKWKDNNSLNVDDPMIGLLTTLTHEIYTHGEVEFILPLFRQWAEEHYGMDSSLARRTLAWISVHCGPTEKNHFFHALDSIAHYAQAMDVDLARYDLAQIVADYVHLKADMIRGALPAVH